MTDEAANLTPAAEAKSSLPKPSPSQPNTNNAPVTRSKRVKKKPEITPSKPPPSLKRTPSRTKSPYFPSNKAPPKRPAKNISCIPFPPLSALRFGLAQERLAHNPFHLLIACVFLTKTRGAVSMPVFYTLITRYPTPTDLANANHQDVVEIFQHLGLQNQRAKRVVEMAKAWCEMPPEKGKRWRRLGYPERGDGKDVKVGECLGDEADVEKDGERDMRVAWEVAHLPGVGAYGLDSWRIFCRDGLRGFEFEEKVKKSGQKKRGKEVVEFEPEWKRVIPLDKELRAYLRWRWLQEGWVWNPITGHKRKATDEELRDADQGGVIVEGDEGDTVESGKAKEEVEERLEKQESDA